ncbi:MAG: PhoH family protein [Lentisphaerae bacterium]|nr:PhoH family protein [Lentisphaerota bacterium]
MKKTFVLDTNVLLHNAESIHSFADNDVVLPMAVIEELDTFKRDNTELGRNARQVIRALDDLRSQGNLRDGVPIGKGGILKIVATPTVDQTEDLGLTQTAPDNRILWLAYMLHRAGDHVIFVSKDINARLKADALGLQAVDFEKQKVNFGDLYAGFLELTVSTKTLEAFYKSDTYEQRGLGRYPNEFLVLHERGPRKRTGLARVIEPGRIMHLSNRLEKVWNIAARNREQRMALELLMDPMVQIVTLVGQAGTGKTLIALAAALHCTLRLKRYDRVLVSRPVIPMGRDIGYLPGAKLEKISHWMQPIFDNLTYLLRDGVDLGPRLKRKTKMTAQEKVEKLQRDNIMEMEALTYIRGRSIPRQYVIIDEAQNLTPHEVKTIISRAGEGTKMVLTGDPYQIDNPYLDASSNGLTYAAERLKGQELHGHVTLRTSERSPLAAIAAENL